MNFKIQAGENQQKPTFINLFIKKTERSIGVSGSEKEASQFESDKCD